MSTEPAQAPTPADLLLHLSRRVRQAESLVELRFIAVNETHALTPYRQAALWLEQGNELTLSGVVSPEANAPYTQWLQRVFRSLASRPAEGPIAITAESLEPQDAAEWQEWLPAQAVWAPLRSAAGPIGGLIFARDEPWTPFDFQLLAEWTHIWRHEYEARTAKSSRKSRFRTGFWRSPWKRVAAVIVLCALIPVRLTVLAPGELVPNHPSVIRAPLEGTVDRFFVTPNQRVKSGEPLFQLDLTTLSSRLAVAQQELATAEAEYRQSAQQAVFEARSKSQLATLQGHISERQTELAYLQSQLQRAQIVAPRDGVVLVDDASEWIGKPVITGEKVMTVADEYDVQVEAWLAPGDLIDMPSGTSVTLYLNAAPLKPLSAKLIYAAHEAVARPDGSFAYRLRAQLAPDEEGHRVGLKGTARISGGWVPLMYWVMRRPLATVRPYIGL